MPAERSLEARTGVPLETKRVLQRFLGEARLLGGAQALGFALSSSCSQLQSRMGQQKVPGGSRRCQNAPQEGTEAPQSFRSPEV